MIAHDDFETQSAVDLKKAGVYRYAEDPSTAVWCLVRRNESTAKVWRRGDPAPPHPGFQKAHNAAFERTIGNALFGWDLKPENQDCTMARANALNLPGSLDALGAALNTQFRKDPAGHALMLKMCRASYEPKPGDLERLIEYCDLDVLTERDADRMLKPLTEFERRLWVLDQHINDRGFWVDRVLVRRALEAAEEAQRRANRRIWELTDGAVEKVTQAKRIVDWLNARGIPAESVKEGDHDELIVKCDLFGDQTAIEVIELRQASSKTFKFQSMLGTACADGRIRGTLVYQGALSGRWTGRAPQPHNMKRIMEEDERTVADAIDILEQPMSAAGHVTALEILCGPALEVLSLCARPMIRAPKGKKLVGGDFSNIEGRLNAWINGEEWKVQAFRDGAPIYEMTAGNILGKPLEKVTKSDRQLWGKVPELACLGPDTLVITDRGPVRIRDVELKDRLWDGIEWVAHAGLVDRGQRRMIGFHGLEMTEDHAVLLGETWCAAQTVASNPHWSRLGSVNASASLLSPAFLSGLRAASGSLWCAVPAQNLNTAYMPATYETVNQLVATAARRKNPATGSKDIGDTPTLSLMTHIDEGFLTAYRLPLVDVTIPMMRDMPITGPVALRYTNPGDAINELFCLTSSAWRDGITRCLNWIEKTWTRVTNPEIYDLLHMQRIAQTLEKSKIFNDGYTSWRDSYDIAHAGPRNRFMILGEQGPLIVHNCGYQGGVSAFHKMGANYGVRVDDATAKRIVNGWREANPRIVEGWYELQQAAIDAIEHAGVVVPCLGHRVHYTFAEGFLWCRLPSSRVIAYPGAIVERKQKVVIIDGDEVTFDNWGVSFWGQKKGWRKLDLYGGMQMAHVVSGSARDILAEAMFRIEGAGYPLVLTVHDEALSEVDAGFGSAAEYQALMEDVEAWCAGLPVAAKAWEGEVYAH